LLNTTLKLTVYSVFKCFTRLKDCNFQRSYLKLSTRLKISTSTRTTLINFISSKANKGNFTTTR